MPETTPNTPTASGGRSPVRHFSWPPFEAGNTAALTHGASSPRMVQPLADQYRAAVLEAAPWAAAPAFAGAVRSWAWAEAQVQLLQAYIDARGMLDEEGGTRSAVLLLDRVEGRLAKLRDKLGLTPTSLARLLTSATTLATATGDAAGLAALNAEGRRILESRGAPG